MSTNNMDRFEFRCIRPEETQQAIEIEQICFPPNEACSPKSLTERIKATAETFLVAEDKETGKLAAFLNGVPTDEEAFRDEFFTDISLSNPEGKISCFWVWMSVRNIVCRDWDVNWYPDTARRKHKKDERNFSSPVWMKK